MKEYLILFLLKRNREPLEYVPTIGISIRLVQKTIILLSILIKSLTNVLEMKYFDLWMDFSTIIQSTYSQLINIKPH